MEWISVKDKTPEKTGRYAVYRNDIAFICYGVAYFNGIHFLFDASLIGNSKYFEIISDKSVKVTHWMPLPDPPKN